MYQHVLLEVLDPSETHSAGGALERSIRAVGTRPLCTACGGSQVQLVRILNIFQSEKRQQKHKLIPKAAPEDWSLELYTRGSSREPFT